jgi:hypothetical protein
MSPQTIDAEFQVIEEGVTSLPALPTPHADDSEPTNLDKLIGGAIVVIGLRLAWYYLNHH